MSLTAVPAIPVPTQDTASPQVQKVLDDMKATAGSRFNAAKRLEANDLTLTWITAMTSAYIIALTVLPYFWKLPQKVTDTLNLTTVVLSVIILVSALLHNSKRDAVNAERNCSPWVAPRDLPHPSAYVHWRLPRPQKILDAITDHSILNAGCRSSPPVPV